MATSKSASYKPTWADAIMANNNSEQNENHQSIDSMLTKLCEGFAAFPFMQHNSLDMQLIPDSTNIKCVTKMQDCLIGNVRYNILHGGVTATMLDSIGGIQVMAGILERSIQNKEETPIALKHLAKVATLDLRVDYLLPGKGDYFEATAEVVRLGRKSATAHMTLVNNRQEKIAIATANYVY